MTWDEGFFFYSHEIQAVLNEKLIKMLWKIDAG